MPLLSTPLKAFAMATLTVFAMLPAHAGSGEEAMETSLRHIPLADKNAEWQNAWMPQASAHAVAVAPSGDLQMGEMLAAYTRTMLDRGGWENTWMGNSQYTANHPLMAVGLGSGATSPLL